MIIMNTLNTVCFIKQYSLIIDLMSGFYNKYKRLFTEKQEAALRNNRSQFINLYQNFDTPKHNYNNLSNIYEDRNNKKIEKLGRSPALDEFQRYILPRLKTQPESVNIFRQANIYNPSSRNKQRLPTLISIDKQEDKKLQPNYVGVSPIINKKYEQHLMNYYKRNLPKQDQFNQFHRKKEPTLLQSSLQTQPTLEFSPKVFNSQKQRNTRIMSINQLSTKQQKPKENNLRRSRQYNIYQPLLYGINQNPYAFAHTKLNDIKQIQKSYPRGLMNQYRKCLLNRLYKKKQIKERREKLKKILQKDIIQYQSKQYSN